MGGGKWERIEMKVGGMDLRITTDIFLFRSEQRLIDRFLETEGKSAPALLPPRFLSTLFRLFGSFHEKGGRGGR